MTNLLTDEVFEQLKVDYPHTYKMVVATCKNCYWERGFYFGDTGVRYDPGCYCNGNTSTKPSKREYLEKFLAKNPAALTRWQLAAAGRRENVVRMHAAMEKTEREYQERNNLREKKVKVIKPKVPVLPF